MKKLILGLVLWFGALAPCSAVVSYTSVGNVNYSVLPTDVRLVPTVALTANRTWTLPSAGGTCIGQGCATALEIIDSQGNVGGANSCVLIAPASGETINGSSSSQTFCAPYGRVILIPTTGSNWIIQNIGPGQVVGTTTNDNAQPGFVGEFITSGACPGTATTATVTITIAAPGVITWTAHGFTGACPIQLTTSGSLPTGLTASTTYWVVPSSITTNTFTLATSVANALAGTAITTTGTQSGTQTGTAGQPLTTATPANVTGVSLTAGDWDCRAVTSRVLGGTTSVTKLTTSISATSATMGTQGTPLADFLSTAANVMGAAGEDQNFGPGRISLSATTNEYLVANDTFTVSTDAAYGQMSCRRVR